MPMTQHYYSQLRAASLSEIGAPTCKVEAGGKWIGVVGIAKRGGVVKAALLSERDLPADWLNLPVDTLLNE